MVPLSHRSIHPVQAGVAGAEAGPTGRPSGAHTPRQPRPHRLASHCRGGGILRPGQFSAGLRQGSRPPAGLAPLRGAVGALLAGSGPLCRRPAQRHQGRSLPQRLSLPGLGGAGSQPGSSLRSLRQGPDRGRPAAGKGAGAIRSRSRPLRPEPPVTGRSGGRHHPDLSGADGGLRQMPRPQVRSHSHPRFLFAAGGLSGHRIP